jgi:hypothetical protein
MGWCGHGEVFRTLMSAAIDLFHHKVNIDSTT